VAGKRCSGAAAPRTIGSRSSVRPVHAGRLHGATEITAKIQHDGMPRRFELRPTRCAR